LEAVRDPHDPAKWHTARGVLSVSGPKFTNWNLDRGGGGAIDLVMHVRQVGFGQALEWLEQGFGSGTSLPLQPTPQTGSLALPPPVAGSRFGPLRPIAQDFLKEAPGSPAPNWPERRKTAVQNGSVDLPAALCQYRIMLGVTQNQFSLTRAASSTYGRAESKLLSVYVGQ
jgi:hypothetical protein